HQVARRPLGGQTQTRPDHVSAAESGKVGKPPPPAADIQHEIACEILGGKAGSAPKSNFRAVALVTIQLCTPKHLPLETKTAGIMLCVDEARNSPQERTGASAALTYQCISSLMQGGLAEKTTKNR